MAICMHAEPLAFSPGLSEQEGGLANATIRAQLGETGASLVWKGTQK